MYGLVRFFRGTVRLRITGAVPERCINRFTQCGLRFWGLCREDALHYTFYAYEKDAPALRRQALRCMASAEVLERHGICLDHGRTGRGNAARRGNSPCA